MFLRSLSVSDFRSWVAADVDFEPGPNVLLGANGQGKTNLVEAFMYLATLTSHRTPTDAPLVRSGAESAVARGTVVSDGRELRIELQIVPGRPNRARLNGTPLTRPRDVLGAARAVLFAPEDLAVVRGDPAERRRFLDELLVAQRPRLSAVRADYDRVLKQRTALLKTAGGSRSAPLPTLDVWDTHLAAAGGQLIRARLDVLGALRPHATAAYAEVAPDTPELTLQYTTSLEGIDENSSVAELEVALRAQLSRLRPQELDRGVTLVGPHRDDLTLSLGPLAARAYASHGESWSTAVALRLGSYEMLRGDGRTGGDPILVLDDVFAELDGRRREQLARVAAKAEQTIVTAAVASDVPAELSGARFDVDAGTVRRVR